MIRIPVPVATPGTIVYVPNYRRKLKSGDLAWEFGLVERVETSIRADSTVGRYSYEIMFPRQVQTWPDGSKLITGVRITVGYDASIPPFQVPMHIHSRPTKEEQQRLVDGDSTVRQEILQMIIDLYHKAV